jgi:ferredoxin
MNGHMDSIIYYFSGTGNSLEAARQISDGLGKIKMMSMASPVPTAPVGGKGAVIGFVFPSYYGDLPRIVRRFVEGMTILPDTYCFAIVTMGLVGSGSITALSSLLSQKQILLNYGKGIVMCKNYILKYNPDGEARIQKMLKKSKSTFENIVKDVMERKQNGVRHLRFGESKLYKNIEHLDEHFFADEHCKNCGLCEKICPVQNICMVNGKPEWQHHCEHCVACIHWCPTKAIQYGNLTQERRQYHHPKVSASDLILPNNRS